MLHDVQPQIIDVRIADAVDVPKDGNGSADLRDQIIEGLSKPLGQKTLPTMLLYDERGLRLYDAITTDCPEYYLFASVLPSRPVPIPDCLLITIELLVPKRIFSRTMRTTSCV